MTVCRRLLLGPFLAPCCPRCHLMALASAACILCHFLIWDFSDAAARTRGKILVDTGSCRPRCASTLIHRATCPSGEDRRGAALDPPRRTEPRTYYGVAALIFCFIFCTLPLLFLGILSQNKYLREMPGLKVCFPLKIWAKTHGTHVCLEQRW